MPEINPLTNNQIFLKKIAENTGSDYETGDVSEINPLTIDQIFLKEIAANTAGQSGDITELEGKVADNTGAIEAITNEYSAKNIANNDATTKTDSGVLFTVNADKSVTVQRQSPTTDPYSYIKLFDDKTLPATPLILSGCPNVTGLTLYLYDKTTSTRYNQTGDEIEVTPIVGHTYSLVIEALNSADLDTAVTVYPVIRDARIKDPTYVPYSMTNRELTERVSERYVSVTGDGVKTNQQLFNDLYGLVDSTKINKKSRFAIVYTNSTFWILSVSAITPNRYRFDGIVDQDATVVSAYHVQLSSTLGDCIRITNDIQTGGIQSTDSTLNTPSDNYEYRVYY